MLWFGGFRLKALFVVGGLLWLSCLHCKCCVDEHPSLKASVRPTGRMMIPDIQGESIEDKAIADKMWVTLNGSKLLMD